ncbi:MAG: large conductance mechanosensitive channel protein MscL [Nocardioidaceae bacterium]
MLKGFKEFVMRGNLVELAVAFIMATAFAAVVTATVDLLMSLVAKASGDREPDFSEFTPGGLPVGTWITALVSFLILAAVVYLFIVVPYNKLQARRARGDEPTPPSEEVTLLTEIRDLLREQRGTDSGSGSSSPGI